MSVTVTGVALILLGLYVFVRVPRCLPNFVIFFAPFSATAVFNLSSLGYKDGGLGVGPAVIYFALYCMSLLSRGHLCNRFSVSVALVFQLGMISCFSAFLLFSLLLHGVNGQISVYQLTQTVYVLIGVFATILLSLEFCQDGGIEMAISSIRASAIFCSFWGLLQFACFVVNIPYPSFIFNNSTSDHADMFSQVGDGFTRIASVAVEPSFFAASMLHFVSFGLTILVAEPRLRTPAWIKSVSLAVFVLLLSTSSTAYFGLAVLALLLVIRWPQTSLFIGLPIIMASAFLLLIIPRALRVLEIMTVEKSKTESFIDRTSEAVKAFEIFVNHPFFGGGWGIAPNFNSITATLANTGLVGLLIFSAASVACLIELQSSRNLAKNNGGWVFEAYAAGVQNALIVSFACSVSSGIKYVVLDDWYFWGLGIAISSRLVTDAPRQILNRKSKVYVIDESSGPSASAVRRAR